MSDSNWRRIYTIGLIIVGLGAAGFAGWLWSSTESSQLEIEQQASSASEAYANPRYIAAESECLTVAEPDRANCISQESEAAREAERNERDLEAQRQMATWTRAIGIATIIGMAFGIFGLSLIFVTFRETRRAADAGYEANKIARESNEHQLRAYVSVIKFHVIDMDEGQSHGLQIFYTNTGHTPALNVRAYFQAQPFAQCDRHYETGIPLGEPKVSNSVLANGGEFDEMVVMPRFKEIAPQIASGEITLFARGWIKYSDVFGNSHITHFRAFCDKDTIVNRGFAFASAGNYAI